MRLGMLKNLEINLVKFRVLTFFFRLGKNWDELKAYLCEPKRNFETFVRMLRFEYNQKCEAYV